jgi:hypothetical protein
VNNIAGTFEHDCDYVVSELRAAVIGLYNEVGADPGSPQDVSRQLGINKTLTWNIAKLVEADDNLIAAPYVPGKSAFERVLNAFANNGATVGTLGRVRAAVGAFDEMVSIHVGDRSNLELLLDSMGGRNAEALELSRKLAFRGNSGIFGIQSRARIKSFILTPNADDATRLDIAMISGYSGFSRLRSTVRWPIFKVRHWALNDQRIVKSEWEPIFPEHEVAGMHGFIDTGDTKYTPPIDKIATDEGVNYELQPGPVGFAKSFHCYRGEILRAAVERYKTNEDSIGECGVVIAAPSEELILDVYAHRELENVRSAKTLVFSSATSHGRPTGSESDGTLLPLNHSPKRLAGSPPACGTPLAPRYGEVLGLAANRLGYDLRDYFGMRVQIKYPPLGAHVVQRFELPTRVM